MGNRRYLESLTDMLNTFGGTQICANLFLDYKNAFDRVRREPLIQCLREISVDGNDVQIIK